ncbi:MAG: DUF2179 domain-containing protein [Candidatus Omnitrophica bacterium]|nr:DUF2179 domain-containing protein [Candidatus Omnitrophota bacterium]MBU1933273.1 DUF2179 domain-containing protein [Candidatus Omnitrophota bacterium]
MGSEVYMYILVPLLIFLARVADVSLGTLRIIFVSRGIRYLAAIFAFFEIVIWLLAISQIMQNLGNVVNYIAYAAGFSMGSFVGISIERKIFSGNLMVRVVARKDATDLIANLSSHGYGMTVMDAQGIKGPVKIILTVVDRKSLQSVLKIVKDFNPNSFYTIEDMRYVTEHNIFPLSSSRRSFLGRFNGSFQKRK